MYIKFISDFHKDAYEMYKLEDTFINLTYERARFLASPPHLGAHIMYIKCISDSYKYTDEMYKPEATFISLFL